MSHVPKTSLGTTIFYFYLRYSVISIKTYKTTSLSAVLYLVHLDLSNNNLDPFLKNIGGPEKGRFTLLGYPSRDKVFL
jgi:hypothetical protein